MYQLGPKICASCVSYLDTTKLLTFALSSKAGRQPAGTPHISNTDATRSRNFAPVDNMDRTRRGRNDTTHTRHVRLGWDSTATDGHQIKVPWTCFNTRTIRFSSSSKTDCRTLLIPWPSAACTQLITQPLYERWPRDATSWPRPLLAFPTSSRLHDISHFSPKSIHLSHNLKILLSPLFIFPPISSCTVGRVA